MFEPVFVPVPAQDTAFPLTNQRTPVGGDIVAGIAAFRDGSLGIHSRSGSPGSGTTLGVIRPRHPTPHARPHP